MATPADTVQQEIDAIKAEKELLKKQLQDAPTDQYLQQQLAALQQQLAALRQEKVLSMQQQQAGAAWSQRC
jgi:hypothetical protein